MAFDVGGGGRKRGGPRPQMNVTPLVDVVLVLLIIFMVVAPLLVKQFHLLLPPQEKSEAPPPQNPDDTQIVVQLRADGTIRINQDVVAREALHDRLQRMFAARVDDIVFFDAEPGANYGEAVALMDIARGAGALTVAVLTERPGEVAVSAGSPISAAPTAPGP
jgi:biopolymer transport protein ExbD